MKPKQKVIHWALATERIVDIILAAENRCMACDGPVGKTSKEITEKELKEIYRLAISCRAESESAGSRSEGAQIIANERSRQVNKEGWTAEHDDEHVNGEMAIAAACYALPPNVRNQGVFNKSLLELLWPWDGCWWKAAIRKRELAKAGALIAAELDRIIRNEKKEKKSK